MKRVILISLAALFILIGNALACGGSCKGSGSCGGGDSCGESSCSCGKKQMANQQSIAVQSAEKVTAKEDVGNKICPIERVKIGSMGEGVKVEYKGKMYNLCCSACISKFEKSPKKYSKIAQREVAKKAM